MFSNEPWLSSLEKNAIESEKNNSVNGKWKEIYGRLLAYAYLDDEMINEILLREGYAKISIVPPNIKI